MKLTLMFSTVFLVMTSGAFAGPASDAVRFFYEPVKYAAAIEYRDRFIAPVTGLFELNDKSVENPDEIGCIDFDPAIDGQDFDQTVLSKTLDLSEKLDGDTGEVMASFHLFENEGEPRSEMIWSVTKVDGKWAISDIASKTNGWQLSQLECLTGESLN